MGWPYDKKLMLNMRAISKDAEVNDTKFTHLWECKVNKETNLYEHYNESIEVNE